MPRKPKSRGTGTGAAPVEDPLAEEEDLAEDEDEVERFVTSTPTPREPQKPRRLATGEPVLTDLADAFDDTAPAPDPVRVRRPTPQERSEPPKAARPPQSPSPARSRPPKDAKSVLDLDSPPNAATDEAIESALEEQASRFAPSTASEAPDPPTGERAAAPSPADSPSAPPKLNVVFIVRARDDSLIQGTRLMSVLQNHGYSPNHRNVWDYCPRELDEPLFSVGHMKEPGTFDIETMSALETPGLVLFAQVPRADGMTSLRAVDQMIDAAMRLCQSLECDLLDGAGNPLDQSRQTELRAGAARIDRLGNTEQ